MSCVSIEMIVILSNPRAQEARFAPLGDKSDEIFPASSGFFRMPDFPLSAERREVNSDDARRAPALIIAQYYRITTFH